MSKYETFFNKIAENLDLTESEFNAVKNSYDALGRYLVNSRYLANYEVDVFPQGSVRLGTVIKPLKRDDYDIDLVCKFTKNDQELYPKEVKHLVGTSFLLFLIVFAFCFLITASGSDRCTCCSCTADTDDDAAGESGIIRFTSS